MRKGGHRMGSGGSAAGIPLTSNCFWRPSGLFLRRGEGSPPEQSWGKNKKYKLGWRNEKQPDMPGVSPSMAKGPVNTFFFIKNHGTSMG